MKKQILMMSIALCVLSAMLVPVHAQTVGVAVDDYFVYEGTVTLVDQVGSPFALPTWMTPWTTAWNNTENVTRTVIAIDGITVSFNATTNYDNGTAPVSAVTAETIFQNYTRWVIGANMQVGDAIGQLGPGGTLNLTEEYTWEWSAGVERDIITAGWINDAPGNYYCTYKNHYDQITGILVSQEVNLTAYSGSDMISYGIYNVMVETNRWVIPEFPTGTVMLLMFVAVTVSIDIYRRKKLKI